MSGRVTSWQQAKRGILRGGVRVSLGAMAGLLAGAGGTAWAAAPAEPQAAGATTRAADSEDIIVTARRQSESIQSVPVAITAVPAVTLNRYAVADVSSLSQIVPGMVVGRQVSGSSASIFLRGVGSTSLSSGFDQSVSLNLDGLAMSRGKELISSQYDLQQIEVLKGPQALFFGKNSTGGVISITTANPTREFKAGVKGGYEFQAREVYSEGYVSGPLSESLSARLAVRASKMDGPYYNTAQANTTNGLLRYPPSDRRGAGKGISGRLSVKYDNADFVNVLLKGSYSHLKDDGAGSLYERKCAGTAPRATSGIADPYSDCAINGRNDVGSVPNEIATTMTYGRSKPYTDHTSYALSATIDHRFGDFTVTSITGQYGFRQQDFNSFSGATAGIYVGQYNKFRQFSEELRGISDFDGPLNFTVGGFYAKTHYRFNTSAFAAILPLDPNTGRYDSFERVNGMDGEAISAFAEVRYNILPTLELAGGARWSHEKKDSFARNIFSHTLLRATFPLVGFTDHFSDSNVSPQATLTWKPTSDFTLYGAYKQGFKSGGYNTSLSILASTRAQDGKFKSERAEGGEIGLRAQLFNRSLRVNVTIYDYRYKDLQVQIFDAATTASIVSNAGQLRTRGVEPEIVWHPRDLKGLELHTSVAYNDAKFKNYIGSCYTGETIAEGCNLTAGPTGAFNNQNYGGRRAPKAPVWAGRVGGSYETDLSGAIGIGFNADASFSSKYNYTDTLRPDGFQQAFTRWDAGARIFDRDRGWEISLIGRNLTNKYIVTTANDMPAQGAGGTGTAVGIRSDLNGIVDRPRQVYLQFSMKF